MKCTEGVCRYSNTCIRENYLLISLPVEIITVLLICSLGASLLYDICCLFTSALTDSNCSTGLALLPSRAALYNERLSVMISLLGDNCLGRLKCSSGAMADL